jgi:hypothetical protein
MMSKRASSKPINIADDISPRVMPFVHHTVENYGMSTTPLTTSFCKEIEVPSRELSRLASYYIECSLYYNSSTCLREDMTNYMESTHFLSLKIQ